jgi:hypothetical protein
MIRKQLTPPERRLFLLLYCALPGLGDRVVFLDPVLESFYWGMDAETQGLIWLVVIFKIKEFGEEKDLDKELARRWRTYLKFYPYWVELMREDEREAKHKARSKGREKSLSEPSPRRNSLEGGESKNELTLEDVTPDPVSVACNPFQTLVRASPDNIELWARKYCTPKDAERVIKYALENVSEEEMARDEGVSQQAISKSIHAGCRAIIKGLDEDGYSWT